jgi:hypothetical protein
VVVTFDESAAEVRAVAAQFSRSRVDVREMWSALHSKLNDLCSEHPLEGDFLRLFNVLENWEVSVGADRDRATEIARQIARRLALRR